MCGISGTVDWDTRRGHDRVERINYLQEHRGPDHTAMITAGGFTIGNTRLSIQDLSSAGNQPVSSPDGRYLCVFNGEIYNFRKLRKRFNLAVSSESDGAVLAPLWELMGEKCLPLLRGMWAIAVIDQAKETLTLARDPFGIKPLHVRTFADGSLAFASEMRALARLHPKPALDQSSLSDYLQFGAVAPDASPFVGIAPIPPNSWIRYSPAAHAGAIAAPEEGRILRGEHPLTAPLEGQPWEALVESVDEQLGADVPAALLLSAGLDSSLLACAAQQRGHALDCFTVTTGGDDDESHEAAITALTYGHRHHLVGVDLAESDIGTFFSAMQRPTIDGINSFLICKAVSTAGYRVALSGLGGDEAIAGYPHMRYFPLLRVLRMLDRVGFTEVLSRWPSKDKYSRLLHPSGPRYATGFDALFREVLSAHAVSTLIDSNPQPDSTDSGTSLRALIDEEVTNYLQRVLLPDADAFSMQWSLELRVPFLDIPYFRAAATSAKPFQGKSGLATLASDARIQELSRLPKRGFSVPMTNWMRHGALRDATCDVWGTNAPIWDLVDRRGARRLVKDAPPDRWATTWIFVALNMWLRSYYSDDVK